MKKKYPYTRILSFSLLLTLSFSSGWAGNEGEIVTRDLSSCVATAKEHNPDLQAAQHSVRAATERVGEKKADYWPKIEALAGVSRWQQLIFLPDQLTMNGLSPIIGPTDDWQASIQANYKLYDGGIRTASVRAAEAEKGAIDATANGLERSVEYRVTEAYFRFLSTREQESVVKRRIGRAEDHVKQAKTRYESGSAPRVDVVRAQADLSAARLSLAEARRKMDVASGELNRIMGLTPETPLMVNKRTAILTDPKNVDLETALQRSETLRLELTAVNHRLEAADQQVKQARGAFKPRITASAAVGRRDTSFFPDENQWSVGVNISIPIFTGGARKHRLQQARYQESITEIQLTSTRLQIRQQVWNAYAALKAAWRATKAADAQVKSADESLRLVRERYQVDAATIYDLLDTEQALAEAEAARVNQHWSYMIAKAGFHWAVGDLHEVLISL